MILRLTVFLLCCTFGMTQTQAQIVDHPNFKSTKLDEDRNHFDFVQFHTPIDLNDFWQSQQFWLNIPSESHFHEFNRFTDQIGETHIRYQQVYHETPIFHSRVHLHVNDLGVRAINGVYYNALNIVGSPVTEAEWTAEEAVQIQMDRIGAQKYMWQNEKAEASIKQHLGQLATYRPQPYLVYYPVQQAAGQYELRLAYHFKVYAMAPMSHRAYVIDANDGTELASFDLIHEGDKKAKAQTRYYGLRHIRTTDTLGTFQLFDQSRGDGIATYDDNTNLIFEDDDNFWNNFNSDQDEVATDAHLGSQLTFDYFKLLHDWESYDNRGTRMINFVHVGNNYVNAYWDGFSMNYGDGDGGFYSPLTTLDVCGHEIGHGVTQNTADLVYAYESGALNESFSDIFSYEIERAGKVPNWKIGEDFTSDNQGFRDISNPKAYGDPDTYQGQNWEFGSNDNGGVHTNSGVQNYWYYILIEGETGVNDNGDSYEVLPVNPDHIAKIVFRNLSVYLTQNSDYPEAAFYAIQSAKDLYGECSYEAQQVQNAWYAVGIGTPSTIVEPSAPAQFFVDQNVFPGGQGEAQFRVLTDTSLIDSVRWTFGDGSSSTALYPSYTYNSVGDYDVQLIVFQTTDCGQYSDTIAASQLIHIVSDTSLAPATCFLAQEDFQSGSGITSISINGNTFLSDAEFSSYQDFTYLTPVEVIENYNNELEVFNVGLSFSRLKVWVDENANGTFEPAELKANQFIEGQTNARTDLDLGSSALNTPYRMRISIEDAALPELGPCDAPLNGQLLDYNMIYTLNTLPPVLSISGTPRIVAPGGTVNFISQVENAYDEIEWAFEGGNISTSSDESPSVTYDEVGVYDVSAVVRSANGNDTVVLQDYIQVTTDIIMNGIDSVSFCTGTLIDNGGRNGDYSDDAYDAVLITVPADSTIRLDFQYFDSESGWDYLYVYDGANTGAPLLGEYTGNATSSVVQSTGNQMYVLFISDGIITDPGYIIHWSCVGLPNRVTVNHAVASVCDSLYIFQAGPGASLYTWTLPDGSQRTGESIAVEITTPPPFDVRLQANMNSGALFDTTFTIDFEAYKLVMDIPDTMYVGVERWFRNYSTNAFNFFWNFDNGTSSVVEEPIVEFNNAGTYNVSLTGSPVNENCRTSIFQKVVVQDPNSIEGTDLAKQIKFYPIPTSRELFVEFGSIKMEAVVLLNAQGQRIQQFNWQGSKGLVPTSNLANGNYILQYEIDGKTYQQQFIVSH